MIIGIDASRANLQAKTGTEWYSFQLIQKLKEIVPAEDQVILYSKEPLQDGLEDLPRNFSSQVLNWPPSYLWTQLRLMWQMIKQQPDVLFVPAHTLPFIGGKKTLTTCHDVGFERSPELYSKKELWYHRFSMRRAVKGADKIIAVSEFTRQEMIELYQIPLVKIVTIYNGFDRDFWQKKIDQATREKILKRFQLRKPYIFYLGRLELKKNIPNLVLGFKEFLNKNSASELQLVLSGNKGYGFDQVQKAISKHQLKEKVRLTGYLSREEHKAILSAAEIFLFPSNYEGFGFPVLEAMACGTPVICSQRASLPEIASSAAEYIDPERPEVIALAIERLINDQSRRKQLVDLGRKRCQDFSWQKCAQETYNLIKSL